MKLVNKYRKYKRILLYDTENVGFPSRNIPSNILILLFVSSFNQKNCPTHYPSNYIVLQLGESYNHTKNAMDFCLVAKIATLLSETDTRQELYIISKDKGYDDAIRFLIDKNNKRVLKRCESYIELSTNREENQPLLENCPNDIIKRINQFKLMNKVVKQSSMRELRRYININTYLKVFSLRKYKKLIVEYDYYKKTYILYSLNSNNEAKIILQEKDREKIIQSFEKECLDRYNVSVISSSDCLIV